MLRRSGIGGLHVGPSGFLQLQAFQMLKIVRFQSQRRLLRRPELSHGPRLGRECDLAVGLSGQVAEAEAGASKVSRECRSVLQCFRSYLSAPRASREDGLPWVREFEGMKRRRTRLVGARPDKALLPVLGNGDRLAGFFVGSAGHQPLALSSAQPTRGLAYHYAEELSDEDSPSCDEKDPVRFVDLQEWGKKLSRFVKEADQEWISRSKKDVGDFDQITDLVKEYGLYGQLYGKVVVISKVPLPNYRPDLDDKLPQREMSVSTAVHKSVHNLLQDHLGMKNYAGDNATVDGRFPGIFQAGEPEAWRRDDLFRANVDRLPQEVLERMNERMRIKQHGWQVSEAGEKMLQIRRRLPSYKERESLLRAIAKNQVLVVSGETGCGKTTQLPQYILESEIEAGRGSSCNIICTQPRRISAISVAERVAAERGEEIGDSVGFKVRLEGMRGSNTRLLFCTTGILLRRLMSDPELQGVTHVIVDEIHERGMNEDFLLIVLKDLLPRRPDLRLVLMSATLNAELFSSFFADAPMTHIPGFTHPVEAYFLEHILEKTGHRLTAINQLDDYGSDKMWKKHRQLATRRKRNQLNGIAEDAMAAQQFSDFNERTQASLACWSADGLGFNLIIRVLSHICEDEREGAVLVFMTGWEDIGALLDLLKVHPVVGDRRSVLLLGCHGSMGTAEQRLIFDKPPSGIRKIVLATNMAETSITIPDVVFVLDTGKCKETSYDALNNTPCLLPSWISQASARQRRGRAGRVKPGVCYHLYPKAVHDALPEYQQPELLRTPLHSLCLQIKSLQLGNISAFLSRALQPPESLAVKNSVEHLKTIGALDEDEELTHLGRHLSMLPLEPRLGKMLIMGAVFRCLDPVLTIAASCTSRDAFVMPMDKKLHAEEAKRRFSGQDLSDHMTTVRAYESWQNAMSQGAATDFCWRHFLSMQTLLGISSLRRQFMGLLTEAGFVDNQLGLSDEYSHDRDIVRSVICSALFPAVVSAVHKSRSTSFKTLEDGQVNLHSLSVNSQETMFHYPWLVFNEKLKTSSVFIRDSTGISDSMLLLFGGQVKRGGEPGHLVMRDGYLEFFMKPELADTIMKLREELDSLVQKKLANPQVDIYKEGLNVMKAVMELVHGDDCGGKWVFGRKPKPVTPPKITDVLDVKGLLSQILKKSGKKMPLYKTREVKGHRFQSMIEVKGHAFLGEPAVGKKQAENNATVMALEWLTGISDGKRVQNAQVVEDARASYLNAAESIKKTLLPTPQEFSKRQRKRGKRFKLSA